MIKTATLTESDIYHILSNPRRRATLRHLGRSGGAIAVADLSTAIAAAETGVSPPPTAAKDSVYTSLHQVHLPTLEDLGVLLYDRDTRTVHRRDHARTIDAYMDVVSGIGITWEGFYRSLGLLALVLVVGSATGLPVVSTVSPLIWATLGLIGVGATSSYQLWRYRRSIRSLIFQ